jgi:hypothetical protein
MIEAACATLSFKLLILLKRLAISGVSAEGVLMLLSPSVSPF